MKRAVVISREDPSRVTRAWRAAEWYRRHGFEVQHRILAPEHRHRWYWGWTARHSWFLPGVRGRAQRHLGVSEWNDFDVIHVLDLELIHIVPATSLSKTLVDLREAHGVRPLPWKLRLQERISTAAARARLRRCHTITVSPELADAWRRYGVHTSVVWNGPVELPPHVAREQGPIRFVFTGNVSQSRNIIGLIEAFAGIPDAHLHLFLPTPAREARSTFAAVVAAASRQPTIHVEDPVPYPDLHARLAGFDVAVSPLFDDNPQFEVAVPNKLVDGIAAGLPVVVTPNRSQRHVVEQHDLGVVSAARTPESVATAARRLVDEPRLLQRLKNSVAGVRHQFTYDLSEAWGVGNA